MNALSITRSMDGGWRQTGRRRAAVRRCARMFAATALLAVQAPHAQPAQAASSAGCSQATMPGGEWPMYGRDYSSSRTQQDEDSLPAARAATLVPRWVFDNGNSSQVLGFLDIASTPVVARGCVYVGDAAGDVVAVDADTGALVWKVHVDVSLLESGNRSGVIVSTVAVTGDRVIVAVNKSGAPYALALDAATGAVRWQSPPLDTQPAAYTNSSPIAYGGVVIVGFSGPEGITTAQGGFAILSATSGELLKKTFTVPEADQAAGYGGGGIWSTAAVDSATGYAYVGTGNPFSKEIEHERTNAILKIDLDRTRRTFGQVVASYKGEIDQYDPVLRDLVEPTCEAVPENPPIPPFPPFLPPFQEFRDSIGCLQLDLDFGAAPNLFRAASGELLVGELQKSGVYHVVRGSTMERERRILVGAGCAVCNGASTAYDPARDAVVADVSPGTLLARFAPGGQVANWASPVLDGLHYQPVAVADGVAYTADSAGYLDAFDVATGLPVLRRSLVSDGAPDALAMFASNGVSVANHTVYVAAGSRIIAYRPLSLPLVP